MTPRIYCDMDGVLANFTKSAGHHFNIDINQHPKEFDRLWKSKDGWHQLMQDWPTFWMDLDPMPHAADLWRVISPYHPAILTAIPEGWPASATGKYVWCKRHLPKFGYHPDQQFHAVLREHKQRYARQGDGTPNILIDDFQKNIREWESAGGIGIWYQDGQVSKVREGLRRAGIH